MAKLVHFELMGPDAAALTKFYEGLFGWTTQAAAGFEGYNLVPADQSGIGGAVGKGSENLPSYAAFYFEVDSIDDTLARGEEAGAKTLIPRTVIPGTVTFAMFSDPAGNLVGLVEPEIPPAE